MLWQSVEATTNCPTQCDTACATKPLFLPRSQQTNSARFYTGTHDHRDRLDRETMNGFLATAFEYTRSFRPEVITDALFGCSLQEDRSCCTNSRSSNKRFIAVTGHEIDNRSSRDWLADYFCLPQDFSSNITFSPHIDNFVVGISWHHGFDEWANGLYLSISAPIVHTNWDLDFTECINAKGRLSYPSGYLGPNQIPVSQLNTCMREYFMGTRTCGDVAPLAFGKIYRSQRETALADLTAILGYNCIIAPDYHLGFYLQTTAPTGTTPNAVFAFEPIAGNGHYWEFGPGINSHWTFWRSDSKNRSARLTFDGHLTHLFENEQRRSFDLVNKPHSRYALVAQLGSPNPAENLMISDVAACLQYQKKLMPAINITTVDVRTKIMLQGEALVYLTYGSDRLTCDIGYNLWGRTKEECKLSPCSCKPFKENTYALKGDAQLYGFDMVDTLNRGSDSPVPLNATQSNATIYQGAPSGNFPAANSLRNTNADTPGLATVGPNAMPGMLMQIPNSEINNSTLGTQDITGQLQVNGSATPILLQQCDLALEGAVRALSHKLFFAVNYTWFENRNNWIPFLGAGAEVEFASKKNNIAATTSQWGIWVKGGISFE